MKKISTLLLLLSCGVLTFGQTNLLKEKMKSAKHGISAKPASVALCDTAISYSDVNASAIGAGAQTWSAGIYFDTVQTKFFGDTTWVEAIQFYISDTSVISGARVTMYEGSAISGEQLGSTLTNGTIILDTTLSQSSLEEGDFTVVMTDSILINNALGYTVFIELPQNGTGYPMGVSAGPMVLGRGGWIELGGFMQLTEANSQLDYNWQINLCVDGEVIIPQNDLELRSGIFNPTGYERLPHEQVKSSGYVFETTVGNIGVNTATGVYSTIAIDSVQVDSIYHGTLNTNQTSTQASSVVQISNAIGIQEVRMDCASDSLDFNASDNKSFGQIAITDSIYSRTSNTSFYITGDFLGGNAYDFENISAIKGSEVRIWVDDVNTPPTDYPMYVTLMNVDAMTGVVDPVPMAISDTILVPDSFSLLENQNRTYDLRFNFEPAVSVFNGQRVLAAFNNPEAGIRRFDSPPIYENYSCFVGNYNANDGTFTFNENPGVYYVVDIVIDSTLFGSDIDTNVYGCTDTLYLEYDSQATADDGSCATLIVSGCTDSLYTEYNPNANVDDGSCATLVNSISENALRAQIEVFPNPANESVVITGLDEINSMVIYNNQGKEIIRTNRITGNSITVDLKDVPVGIYQVVLESDKIVVTEKLSVQK